MTLIQRRLLYSCFILLFLIITPLISFYAAGYTLNSATRSVERTSILIVETTPKGATVDLGADKKYNWLYSILRGDTALTTPLKLRNLLPDDYDITITKDGYFDYHAKIALVPGQTIVAENIILLKRATPELVTLAPIIKTALSPDGSKLAAISTSTLQIITLNTGRELAIPLAERIDEDDSFDVVWSPRNDLLLLTAGAWTVFDAERGGTLTEVRTPTSLPLTKARWHGSDNNTLLLTSHDTLYSFDIPSQTTTEILTISGLQDALARDDRVLTLEKNTARQNRLAFYETDAAAPLKTIALPLADNYQFLDNVDKTLYVYEPQHDLLYIIDPSSFLPLRDSISNVGSLQISAAGMTYWNDFELWTYDINGGTRDLLTRISTRINSAALTENYAIYAAANSLTALELTGTDYRNIQPLLEWSGIGDIALSQNNKYLYFTSALDDGRGLYRLEIR